VSVLGPRIIEDDECDLCDERAVPYDDDTDLPYCPQHKAEVFADVSLEDFTLVRPRSQVTGELSRLTRPLVDETMCTQGCGRDGMSRLSPAYFMSATFDTCTDCAFEVWTDAYLPDSEWLLDLAAEVDTGDELDLFADMKLPAPASGTGSSRAGANSRPCRRHRSTSRLRAGRSCRPRRPAPHGPPGWS
jgi:hypothetical protein